MIDGKGADSIVAGGPGSIPGQPVLSKSCDNSKETQRHPLSPPSALRAPSKNNAFV